MRSYDSASTARTPSSSVPFAAQSRDEPDAVLLAREHDQRRAALPVALGRVEDARRLAAREVRGDVALGARHEQVLEPDVRERAARHDEIVAAPRAVRVEVALLESVLAQESPCGAVERDVARRRDVIGRDGVADHHEHACAADVGDRLRLHRHALEERRLVDVRRVGAPRIQLSPPATGIAFQLGLPSKTLPYSSLELLGLRVPPRSSPELSRCVGHRSRRKTGLPSLSWPSGSLFMSMSTVPASAYATTSGGEAR